MNEFTYEDLSKVFELQDGIVLWKIKTAFRNPGDIAGKMSPDGYRRICYKGKTTAAHRMVWMLFYKKWPAKDLDHINGKRNDNRIENLREATKSQNRANSAPRLMHSHGGKGVTLLPHGKWQAQISKDGKNYYLGSYVEKQDALSAYASAAKKMHGDFAYEQRTT